MPNLTFYVTPKDTVITGHVLDMIAENGGEVVKDDNIIYDLKRKGINVTNQELRIILSTIDFIYETTQNEYGVDFYDSYKSLH